MKSNAAALNFDIFAIGRMSAYSTITIEPEEAVEAALVSRLTAAVTIPVEGVMTTAASGEVKRLTADTFLSVAIDLASQDLDFCGPRVPCTFTARVTVHYALADDPNAAAFRDTCRATRAALLALTGDGCDDLGASGFACDAFILDSTSTSFEAGENPTNTKTYSATIKGRITNTNETEA